MLRATSKAGLAIIERVDHYHDIKFSISFYLMRDLLRIIDEKEPGEPFGIAFGDEQFIHIFDVSDTDQYLSMYKQYYQTQYPQAIFYFWDGTQLEKMDCPQFFVKVKELA